MIFKEDAARRLYPHNVWRYACRLDVFGHIWQDAEMLFCGILFHFWRAYFALACLFCFSVLALQIQRACFANSACLPLQIHRTSSANFFSWRESFGEEAAFALSRLVL